MSIDTVVARELSLKQELYTMREYVNAILNNPQITVEERHSSLNRIRESCIKCQRLLWAIKTEQISKPL